MSDLIYEINAKGKGKTFRFYGKVHHPSHHKPDYLGGGLDYETEWSYETRRGQSFQNTLDELTSLAQNHAAIFFKDKKKSWAENHDYYMFRAIWPERAKSGENS